MYILGRDRTVSYLAGFDWAWDGRYSCDPMAVRVNGSEPEDKSDAGTPAARGPERLSRELRSTACRTRSSLDV